VARLGYRQSLHATEAKATLLHGPSLNLGVHHFATPIMHRGDSAVRAIRQNRSSARISRMRRPGPSLALEAVGYPVGAMHFLRLIPVPDVRKKVGLSCIASWIRAFSLQISRTKLLLLDNCGQYLDASQVIGA